MLTLIELRKTILAARDGLSVQHRHVLSSEILKRVLLLEEVQNAATLFVYVDFRSEVETRVLIAELLRQGKRVAVPVTLVKEKRLLAIAIHNLEQDLAPGYCSILEPRKEIRQSQVVPGCEIETILLPGSVFDEQGGRLGYGGGYYDRFMAYEAPKAHRIGLAFELQVVDRLSLQPHDKPVDLVVTEKRVIQGRW